ncbi:hypothetical protein CEP54_015059 [Fusarium duplospermum]|uniref:HNH nuclease domain-containing protein n=1 Tax=Fusarium duplospermum TaxID=1325734 RepID=A0A428NRX6_9HYPO|nr:hypothetical protein CEP54_015059 [Fusarium duplospermum]
MSNASVTPQMRVSGWNVHLLAGPAGFNFAGFYLHEENTSYTYRDLLEEIFLCFELPENPAGFATDDFGTTPSLAFGFSGFVNPPPTALDPPVLALIGNGKLDQVVPSPPQSEPWMAGDQTIARYHLVYHNPCAMADSASLAAHLQGLSLRNTSLQFSSKQADKPQLAAQDTYYGPVVEWIYDTSPPKKPSVDPRITRFPLRRTVQPRRASPKRSASASTSPSRQDPNDEEDMDAMVAPPEMAIAADQARQTIASFRSNCLVAGKQCAVTARGRSWCSTPAVGPSLQACHIIPQQHYHVYPDPDGTGLASDASTLYSPDRLQEAWQRTWSADNGILLLSHLHELFDARLFSIHPDTLLIRAFVPYDVLLDYHGKTARVPVNVDRAALRHHYQMCCIENMAAKAPLLESPPVSSTEKPSPFAARTDIPLLQSPRPNATAGDSIELLGSPAASGGDPSKRARSAHDDTGPPDLGDAETPSTDDASPDVSPHTCKRRKVSVGRDWGATDWNDRALYTGFLTDKNSVEFLADVNWSLQKAMLMRREE